MGDKTEREATEVKGGRAPRKRTMAEWTEILAALVEAAGSEGSELTVAQLQNICQVVATWRLRSEDVAAFKADMQKFAALVAR